MTDATLKRKCAVLEGYVHSAAGWIHPDSGAYCDIPDYLGDTNASQRIIDLVVSGLACSVVLKIQDKEEHFCRDRKYDSEITMKMFLSINRRVLLIACLEAQEGYDQSAS